MQDYAEGFMCVQVQMIFGIYVLDNLCEYWVVLIIWYVIRKFILL